MDYFIDSFRTPFWLDGPLGCTRVSVDFSQLYFVMHMISLPYALRDKGLLRTLDLLDMQFNIIDEQERPLSDVSNLLADFWRRVPWLKIQFGERKDVPLSFLRTLQTYNKHGEWSWCALSAFEKWLLFHHCPLVGELLVLFPEKGILPADVEDYVQLMQFTMLKLVHEPENTAKYELHGIVDLAFILWPCFGYLTDGMAKSNVHPDIRTSGTVSEKKSLPHGLIATNKWKN
jgi:hypothetical protein